MNQQPIIFINGMMKTGTTMLLNLLDGHPEINIFPDETVFEVLYLNSEKDLYNNFIENNNCRLFRKVFELPKHPRQAESFDKLFNDEFIDINIDRSIFKRRFNKLLKINESHVFIKNFFDVFFSSLTHDQRTISEKKYICYKSPSFSNPKSKNFLVNQINDILKINKDSKIIIPLRNPEDLIKSLILHEIRAHNKKFNFLKRIFFVIKSTFEIETTLKDYSKLSNNTYFFKYEDLIENNMVELEKLLNFLNIEYDKALEYTSVFKKRVLSETSPIATRKFKILNKNQLASNNLILTKFEKYLISLFDVYELNFLNKDHPLKKLYNYNSMKLSKNFFIKKLILIILKFYYR